MEWRVESMARGIMYGVGRAGAGVLIVFGWEDDGCDNPLLAYPERDAQDKSCAL